MTVQNQDIQHVQTENKAKEFERKKQLRNQIGIKNTNKMKK